MVPVPYRGEGPALIDLIGGQVQVMFAIVPSAIEYIRSGRLRALAVTSATRVQPFPEIPAVGEFVPGYQATAFEGVGAPKNTPTEIVDKLNREINALLDDPKVRAQLASLGSTVLKTSPTSFGKLIADETSGARSSGQPTSSPSNRADFGLASQPRSPSHHAVGAARTSGPISAVSFKGWSAKRRKLPRLNTLPQVAGIEEPARDRQSPREPCHHAVRFVRALRRQEWRQAP
jgi:hypothetical protein